MTPPDSRARRLFLAAPALLLLVAGSARAEVATAADPVVAAPGAPAPVGGLLKTRLLGASARSWRLAEGGFPLALGTASASAASATGATTRPGELPGLLARRLAGSPLAVSRQAAVRFTVAAGPTLFGRDWQLPVGPRAMGDRLLLALDDGFGLPVADAYETRLDVSGGPAGATDAVAVRFPMRSVGLPPLRVTDVLLGLEDLHGATTWPSIEVWVEDAANPLQPRQGALSTAVTGFDAVAGGLNPLPALSLAPTSFLRLAAGLPSLDVPDAWLSDSSFDDAFERTDAPLDNSGSDWLECADGSCEPPVVPRRLQLLGSRVQRPTGGVASLGVKFQDGMVYSLRAARDIDLDASVVVDLGAVTATRAGLAVRALAPDAYYRVEYVKGSATVEVDAVTPGGVIALGSFAAPGPADSVRLGARVTGATPGVTIEVFVDGSSVGTATDAVARFAGELIGIVASDAGSAGEAWDDLTVLRRPDLFAVIEFPPGVDAALPLDVSDGSVISDAVLLSQDGSTFWPRAATSGCVNPGNPFVSLEVEDSTALRANLAEVGAHVVSVGVACATCPQSRNACAESRSRLELQPPVLTVGESADVAVAWWNEHLDDADRLLLRATLWDAPCADGGGALVAASEVVVGADTGQPTAGLALRSAQVLSFVPSAPGGYCLVVEELHDLNSDCCPDGAEGMAPFPGAGCPMACTPAVAADGNVTDALVLRELRVEAPCMPRTVSNLAADSLRVTRDPGERVATHLTFARVDAGIFWTSYNVHAMPGEPLDPALGFTLQAPVVAEPLGAQGLATVDLEPAVVGVALWIGIFESDGCPTGNSVLP